MSKLALSAGLLAVVLLLLVAPAACRRTPTPSPAAPTAAAGGSPGGGGRLLSPEPTPGIRLRLADADPSAAGPDAAGPPVVAGAPLDAADVARRLDRLPPLDPAAAVTAPFAVRAGPLPPAIPGETIPIAFPPPDAEAPPDASAATAPPKVVRVQPEGDVPLAAQLAVTFDRPFVDLTGNRDNDAVTPPVKLEPQPEGRWRWVGTQTVLFEPDGGHLPMATHYTAEVPADATASDGVRVAEGKRWTFHTPPPQVVAMSPAHESDPVDRQPVIVLTFDQVVDLDGARAKVSMTLDTGGTAALRPATDDEIAADDAARAAVAAAAPGRWLALRPAEPLPVGAVATVAVAAGVPSAEGPRTDAPAWQGVLHVYDAFRALKVGCEGVDRRDVHVQGGRGAIDRCEPFGGWWIEFNNPIDAAAFDPASVTVEPAVPGLAVESWGSTISLRGITKGRTTYTVRVAAGVRDTFGQSLDPPFEVAFTTGAMRPALAGPGERLVTLDPAGPKALVVATVNMPALEVLLFAVDPEAWPTYEGLVNRYPPPDAAALRAALGDPAVDRTVRPKGAEDTIVDTPIDLGPALKGGHGHVVAFVAPPVGIADPLRGDDGRRQPVLRWVQVTELAVDAFRGAAKELVWVTRLADGRPVDGARIAHRGVGAAVTGADGVAELTLPRADAADAADGGAPDGTAPIVATVGDDVAFTLDGGSWLRLGGAADELRFFVFDDRGLYRPGETVHVKGYVRRVGLGLGGDVDALGDGGPTALRWTLTSMWGDNEIGRGTWAVNDAGAFDGAIALPADAPVGEAQLQLEAADGATKGGAGLTFGIAEFRRPEFRVAVAAETAVHTLGDTSVVVVAADYYSGGRLPGAAVTWQATARRGHYSPPGWDGFTFGEWTPWWWGNDGGDVFRGGGSWPADPTTQLSWTGRTGEDGRHRLAVDVSGVEPLAPASIELEATVQDVNRQAITGRTALLVHPSAHYVGLRQDGWVVEAGKPWRLDAVVTDIDGAAVAGRAIGVTAVRVTEVQRGGQSVEETAPAGGCDLESAEDPVPCTLTFDQGGRYRVVAEVADDRGRPNRTTLTIWVQGDDRYPSVRGRQGYVVEDVVELIPDAEVYDGGDTATLLVQAPFAPSEALITIRRSGIVRYERRSLATTSTTIEVPIAEGDVPNVTVAVDVVGAVGRDDGGDGAAGEAVAASDDGATADDPNDPADPDRLPSRPAFASGAIDLKVSTRQRTLGVAARPSAAQVRPGAAVSVTVAVTDAAGAAVAGAEVALVVVDEAVLALSAHDIGDPVEAFYGARDAGVYAFKGRGYVVLATAEQVRAAAAAAGGDRGAGVMVDEMGLNDTALDSDAEMSSAALRMAAPVAAGRGGGGGDGTAVPVVERVDLDALAAFVPSARTGADGRAAIDVRLPDSVTRYRIWAVATDGARRFGKGEAGLTAALPLVVRPSAPRFLNFGDAFELPVVVQNPGAADRTVDVVVRGANLAFTGPTGMRVDVPAGDRVEVRFPAKAVMAGTAVFQAAALDADDPAVADAQRVTLPVWTPTTTEAFATYGTLGPRVGAAGDAAAGDGDTIAAQLVARPSGAVPSFGGLSVTASSTALGNLTDAIAYLNSYPYECTEQIASRLLANVALIDVLDAFDAPGLPSRAAAEARIAADIAALRQRQMERGGFGSWTGADRWMAIWSTIHATQALVRAREKGYAVDGGSLERALDALRNIRSHIADQPWPWSPEARRAAEAYALSVRAAAGDADGARAAALFGEAGDEAPVDVMGWLLGVIAVDDTRRGGPAQVEILRRLTNRVSETAAGAQFTVGYDEVGANLILASNRRADAVVLDALMTAQPDSDLILKVVRGLLDSRERGRWGSTQENAFVLLALDRYFRTYEADEPAFTARVWLGDGLAGEARFEGRSADRQQIDVPLAQVPEAPTRLTVAKDGPGRLYYRLGLTYAPDPQLDCPAGDCPALGPPPDSRGFTVERRYEAVDDPGDVARTADGGWTVKAGARVRVRLTLVAPARRYQVALVDPLPAGFEAENPDLATSASPPPDTGDGDAIPYDAPWRWWGWWWYDHTGLRDDRAEVFAWWLEGGVYRYSYIARATTPGTFVAPGPKAEEMYHPETFGRGAAERVRVVAAP